MFRVPRGRLRRSLVPVGLAALGALAMAGPARAAGVQRITVSPSGEQSNAATYDAGSFSADGRLLVFSSAASNLVDGDTNGQNDLFLHEAGVGLQRLAVAPGGAQANGSSTSPVISANGRYVTFASQASNLVPGDTNNLGDIFLLDRQTGDVELISKATDGRQANSGSGTGGVSDDGRYVAFWSYASNLVDGDTNNATDVFVRDRVTGTTKRISETAAGGQGNGLSQQARISSDGRYVAFETDATNLIDGDTNGTRDVVVKDLQSGALDTASVNTAGEQVRATGGASLASISADGRFVVMSAFDSNLVPGDNNVGYDGFVRDRQANTTERVTLRSDGRAISGYAYPSTISADGRYVAFYSYGGFLSDDDGFFVRDRQTNTTTTAITATDGATPNNTAGSLAMSADGHAISVATSASNLVDGDTNGYSDVFTGPLGTAVSVTAPAPPKPDLVWDVPADAPSVAKTGDAIGYALTLRNSGADASGVSVAVDLPDGVVVDKASIGGGSCTASGGRVTCSVGALAASGEIALSLRLYATKAGELSVPVVASSTEGDAQPADNTVTRTLTVGGPDCTIVGTPGDDVLIGTDGDDVICGLGGNDTLRGGPGNDLLLGGDGDDTLSGGAGDDRMDGGTGRDTVDYSDAPAPGVRVDFATGTATGDGTDSLSGFEAIRCSTFDDYVFVYDEEGGFDVFGGNGDDHIKVTGRGHAHIDGGAGIDTIDYSEAPAGVRVDLAAHLTTAVGGGTGLRHELVGIENAIGSAHDDVLLPDPTDGVGNDLSGGAGDDTLGGGDDGDSHVDGGEGVNTLDASDATEGVTVDLGGAFCTCPHHRTIVVHVKRVRGSRFNDVLRGGAGDDILIGGGGDDLLAGGGGDDTLDGGDGTDTVDYSESPVGVRVDLIGGTATGEGADTLTGIENAHCSPHDDLILLGGAQNIVHGGGGTDTVDYSSAGGGVRIDLGGGGAGNLVDVESAIGSPYDDTLLGGGAGDRGKLTGGGGNDTLIPGGGGASTDRVDGGPGVDTVDFSRASSGVDVDLATGRGPCGCHEGIVLIENVTGSSFGDDLKGDDQRNVLVGGDGDDKLDGRGGDDTLSGGTGDDTLIGGPGRDDLDGGSGTNELFQENPFTPPTAATPCKVTYGGGITTTAGAQATFGGNAIPSAATVKGQQQFQDHGPSGFSVHSMTTSAVACTANRVSIYGTAARGTATVRYRIDLVDNGEPGTNDTYRMVLSDGYDTGRQKLLTGGNVQVHSA
jgi:Ca2+-binding RTX toxin-like protein